MNKKKGFRKILAGILAVTMIVTSVPTSVYADEEIPADAVSEERTIGSSDSSNEPITLKNNTGSDISFVAATRKEDAENENAVTNALQNDEVIAADETVKFYADFVESSDYVLIIKCNGNTYYINTFDYFATDLSKEVSIENDKDNNVLYLKGTKRDGSSFDSLNAELEYIKTADMAEGEEVESIELSEETTETVTEEVTDEVTEEATEEIVEAVTEEITETKTKENTEEKTSEKTTEEKIEKSVNTFEKMYNVADLSNDEINAIDFSSCELLIATEDESIFTADTNVVSGYDGVYLTKYDNVEITKNAFTYYYDKADFVEANIEFKVSENEDDETSDTADLSEINTGDDAISVLNDIVEDGESAKGTIAVIDTGINADDLIDKVSLLGDDVSDDNGHGTKMYNYIREEDADAKILSIKAMDKNGKGQVSDVYAAIQYAIEKKADIILLSISAYSTQDSEIIKAAIDDATDKGIIVVGAAGNYGKKVKYYIPGNIESAVIAGSVDKDGYKKDFSNYGDTVDYYVVSESTSEAAARLSGIISKDGKSFKNDSVILPDKVDFGKPEEKKDDEKEDNKEDEIPLEERTGTFDVQAYDGSGDGQNYLTYIGDRYVTWGSDVYSSSFGVATRKFFICDGNDYAGESWNGYCVDPSLTKPDKGVYKVYEVGIYIGKVMYYMYGAPGWDTPLSCLGDISLHQYINNQGYTTEGGYVTVCHYLLATLAQTQRLGGTGYTDAPNWVQGLATVLVQNAPNSPKGFHCYFAFSYEKNHNWQNVWGWKMSPPPYMVTLEKSSTVASDNRSLDGIKYGLYNAEDKLIATYTLGADGKTKAIDIYKGTGSIAGSDDAVVKENGVMWLEWWSSFASQKWYFKELNTNSNYAVKSSGILEGGNWTSEVPKYNITVKQGEKSTAKASDAPVYGMIEVFKYADKDKTKPLAGAEFTVYRDANCTQVVGKMAHNDANGRHEYTSSRGYATLTGLAPGTYYVKETKAPNGYTANKQTYTVHVKVSTGQVSWGNAYMGYVFDPVYYFNNSLTAAERNTLGIKSTSADNLSAEDIDIMFRHYIKYGLSREVTSRIGTPYFRADQYLANRPDLATAWVSSTDKANYNNSVNVFAAYHYAQHGAREGAMGRSPEYYAGLNDGVNHDGQISVAVVVSNTPEKYYVGIKKHDADNPNQFIAATFDIYGTNTSGATSGGTKINALSNKSTSATTGLLNVDVSDYYNTGSSTVTGKYKYFYAVETKTDSNHIITVSAKALTVGQNVTYTDWPNAEKVYVQLVKTSATPECVKNNPNYTLAGTQYKVFKTRPEAVAAVTSGNYSASIGDLDITTARIDSNGVGTSNMIDVSKFMSVNPSTGKYRSTTFYAVESKAGKGYKKSTDVELVTVTAANTSENPAKFNAKNTPVMDPVQIEISKVDADGKAVAEGAGNLEGAQFTIKFYAVDVDTNYTAAQLAQRTADATWTIQTKYDAVNNIYSALFNTDWLVGGTENNSPFYYVTGNPDPRFPAGYITIQETNAPTGYTTKNPVYKAQKSGNALIATNGVIVANTKDMENLTVGNVVVDGKIILEETPIRGDFELLKTDETGKPMANVEFKITSKVNGITESHTFKTGADGKYSSKTDDDMWFAKKTDGSETPKDKTQGALPYGTYVVEELRCDANKGYQLEPAITFTVSDSITYTVKDGKVTENAITNVKNPVITTSASVTETGTKLAPQNSTITIKDTVSYSNLKVNTDYISVGKLMVVNEDNTSSVYQKNGKDYVVTKTFKTGANYTKSVYEAKGTVDVEFEVDTTDLDGKKLVVFEKVYLGTTAPADDVSAAQYPGTTDKIFPVIHENLDDSNQTIIIPKVITQAYKTGDTTNKTISAVANASITDTISYTNLDASLTYSVKSSLIDKSNGNVLKDATGKEVTVTNNAFKPTSSNGTHNVTFTFDATGMEGKTLVVFEEISYNNKVVASHTVLTDIAQTVYVPSLKSQVKDSKTKDQMTLADKDASITDTIEYSNLTPGTEYVVKGTMMDKAAKTALKDSSGKTVTVSVPFTPTATSGKQDVVFTFDASGLEGKTIVAFQDIYLGDTIIASENDYDRTTQTIYIPSGQTEAKDSETKERISNADESVTINDEVSYKNLIPGKKYTTVGKLVNKKTGKTLVVNGKEITNTVEFTADKPDGTMIVPFTFDASALEGETYVVFEDVYYDKIPVIIHHDINDENQTPKFPKVRTTVADGKTADHVTLAEDKASFTDTVTYENVLIGKKYKVTGTLMNKATKSALLDADGKEIKVSSEPFVASNEKGTVKVKFTFDASLLEGATIVVYEELILIGDNENVVGTHKDINDKEQTIYIPKAGTTAKDSKTNDQITLAEKDAKVIDTVTYENLLAGKTYTVTGKLYDKETEKPFLINGNEITKTVEFTPTEPNGKVDVEFVFDAKALEGKTVVVFEDIALNGKLIAVHHDIKDTKQMIYIPKGKTTVKDDKTGDKITYAEKEASITDTMSYTNLIPGKEYVLTGKLMDKNTNKPVLRKDGTEIVNSTPFKPTSPDGSVELTFKFDSSLLKGKKIVVFEDVTYEDKPVIIEHNIDDEEQTTRIPDGHTTVRDTKTEDHITFASEEAEIIDTVFYENLIPNKEYTLTGYLMDKGTKEPVLDKNGNKITNTTKFTPDKESGTTDIPFKFNSEVLKGQKIVVFEDVYYNGKPVFTHHEIDDVDQTTSIPKGHTVLLDDKTKDHLTLAEEKATVTDTIYYEGLIVGKEYKATGVLMDKATGKPILDDDGKEITNTVPFKAETENGIIKVPFTFDAMLLKGKSVVVFEDVYYGEKSVFCHHDINDIEQTTWIPDGHTTAKDAKTGDHITLAEENAHIDDTITYKNLIADGRTYTATGVLMDKATGEAVLDKNGNEITNTVTFVPEKADGEVVVPFDFDASILKGQKIVVFENVGYGGKDVFIHHELNDVDQTTTIPGGSTQAKDTKTYTNMALAEPQTTIFDFILYEGLIADGREYEATGVLMDQKTGNPLLDKNGKEITNTVTFKPEKESGYITVPFTFDSSLLKGKTIVVFEDVYWDKKAVFIHHDITDKPQTVVFPEVLTTATLKNGGKTVTAGDEVTVVDEVLINNILKDEEYIVKGKLMNKSTGKPFTVGGKELTAEKSFKAEDSKTVITTEFTFSTKGIDKIDLVVFEELYVVREINGKKTEVLVSNHADLNDKNQTVNIITVPKTGDTSPVLPIAGVCMAALLGIGVVMYKKKKRREE